MERTSPDPPPHGSAQPRSPQPSARDRLASLQQGPTRHWSPAASGPMPLSEALAARRTATHPRWRKAAAHITTHLHARWALTTTAATALALLAVAGAAVGAWYLTRSHTTVVDVGEATAGTTGGGGGGGGNAGEANAAADGPAGGKAAASGAASRDDVCATRPPTVGTPSALGPMTGGQVGGAALHSPGSTATVVSAVTTINHRPISAAMSGALEPANSGSSMAGALAHPLGPAAMSPPADALAAASVATDLRHQPPNPQPCPSRGPALPNAVPSAGAVVVDVEGKVAHPGVQTMPAGSRVYEALAAAGGALPGVDVTALDLARAVADGEQLRVGIAGEPSPAVGVAGPSVSGKGKRKGGVVVDLNTATLEQLESVPDVGPAMAQRILEWRAAHGRFASVGQLRQVRGIGERKFAEMRDSVTV